VEVVKDALACGSTALLLMHGRPEGLAKPPLTDEVFTETLKSALSLVEMPVLDYLIVGGSEAMKLSAPQG
jgi:DNA repair protein RadC